MNGSIVSWLLLAISTTSIFSNITGASASVECLSVDQRLLLLELRNSLIFNTSKSSKLVKWDHHSASSWSGVTCEDGLIVGLDLSDESISGGIDGSSSLFRLEFLRSLNLAFNYFNFMAIPSGLANLSRLEHLNLSNANFTSGDRLELEKPNLRSLIGDLGELRELYLDGVYVPEEGREWCDALSSSVPKLEVLSMSDCSLSGPFDASLMSLANLSVIQLKHNYLSTTVPSFLANFFSLKTLNLSNCDLQGEFPDEVFQVQTLQNLDLSFNELLQGSLPDFPVDSSLETMVLGITNFSGRLPDSIGDLRKLSRLDLSNCRFTGSIPSSMENLSELTYLDLSSNNLTGSIPPYGASRNLTQIILSDNSLTGQITSVGWENLLNLEILDLEDNSLEGDIPPAMFTLPRLKRILLSHNRFSGELIIYPNVSLYQLGWLDLGSNLLQGSVPVSIFELQGLTYLSLSFNNFSGSLNIDVFQGFGNLTYLDLSYSGLSISAMVSTSTVASSFPKFHTLNLASCQLQTLPQFLANQSDLVFLDLSHNHFHGDIPRWLWTLENLSNLNLSSNVFEDLETPLLNITSPLWVIDLHSNMLRWKMPDLPLPVLYLDFSENNIHGSIPKSICKANDLKVLDLSRNNLNGIIPDCVMTGSLKVLNLRNNQLSGNIPQNILAPRLLQVLDISENFLQGQIPLSWANCTMLETVNLGDNQIDGTFPCHFKAISSLRVLVLRSNKLHGEIGCPHSPNAWQMLQIIDLSSNNFSGTLPASLLASWEAMKANVDFHHLQYEFVLFSNVYYQETVGVIVKGLQLELVKILTTFTSIDFSGNRLEGPIPDTLADLKALYFLNLSHNAISGSISPVLGNLHQLESLDLSWNYLNGTIPAQLANLNFLSFLNLSNNQLVGSIPAWRQFLTFSKSSFEGNLGLCGFPLDNSCSTTTNGTPEAGSVPTQSGIDVGGNNDDSKKKWFYMGMPLGFVVGFWVFCGPIVFIRSWRFAYYRFWDEVLFRHSSP
ncbi:receptor-like protein 7 [Eucalyptus grandis]|uniref:receptor-like protein 7 n=1 Tax=Eucalyptus grandis TaxID=71139 RepID=UPI00192EF76C|nr:receptor-like protein 7 [Eucalyptus grandis]